MMANDNIDGSAVRCGKMDKAGRSIRLGQIRAICIFHMIPFLNMYLPFNKSCSKLFSVKCNTLNSPPILRKSSTQQIGICLVIIKILILLIKIK